MNRNILVNVFFYENVRKTPPYGNNYYPHFVVRGTTEYLGIKFIHLQKEPLGESITAEVKLLYDVDYSLLVPYTNFVIKEGATTVGEGVVLA